MNEADKQRMLINKKGLIDSLKERKSKLEGELFQTIKAMEKSPSQKMVAKKELLRQSVMETKERIKEVERPDFDGTCEECTKPIAISYLEEHIFTNICEKCSRKKRAKELRKR